MQKESRRLAAVATILLALMPRQADADDPARLAVWDRELAHAEQALREGHGTETRGDLGRVFDELCGSTFEGDDISRLIGRLLALLSLAEVVAGERASAFWHWKVALELAPEVKSRDLAIFGEAGLQLERWIGPGPMDLDGKPLEGVLLRVGGDVQAPRRIPAPHPDCVAAPCQRGVVGKVIVQLIIDELGRVSQPRVLKAWGPPAATLATLEDLRCWSFEPARVNGQPVRVYYTVTVNFKS